jgi:hypothetical protein
LKARSIDVFLFSDTFISKPLPFFGGLFPLFVQWEDYKASMFNMYVQYICMYACIGVHDWLMKMIGQVSMKMNRTDFSKKIDDEMIFGEHEDSLLDI